MYRLNYQDGEAPQTYTFALGEVCPAPSLPGEQPGGEVTVEEEHREKVLVG